jgi:hypothetical protein
MGGVENDEAVERGFARFKDKQTVVDEPLAILALQNYFNRNTTWTMDYFMRESLTTAIPAARGVAFEHFCVYHLLHAFRTPRQLSEVFEFLTDNPIQHMTAEVVTIVKSADATRLFPLDIDSDVRPNYILGCSAATEPQSLSSLQSPEGIAFCFLAKTIGPDVVLFLKLLDGSLLRVLIQFKQWSRNTISAKSTEEGFLSTSPAHFISRRLPKTKTATSSQPRSSKSKLYG